MINGLESAHDYLWLIQDAWMAPDVWAWADGCAEAKACTIRMCSNHPACANFETRVAEFKRCSSCHFAFYCSRECQKADWKLRHKAICGKPLTFDDISTLPENPANPAPRGTAA